MAQRTTNKPFVDPETGETGTSKRNWIYAVYDIPITRLQAQTGDSRDKVVNELIKEALTARGLIGKKKQNKSRLTYVPAGAHKDPDKFE